jgi:uncharacterized protein
VALLAAAALALGGCHAAAQSKQTVGAAKPDLALTGRVVDAAHILTPGEQARLEQQLVRIESATKVQFAVVTTPALRNVSVDKYALTLFNSWGLGDKNRNDGLMLLVAPNDRKARIEVGKGLERRLPNSYCAAVMQRMIPSFSSGKYPQGIQIGVSGMEARLRGTIGKAT